MLRKRSKFQAAAAELVETCAAFRRVNRTFSAQDGWGDGELLVRVRAIFLKPFKKIHLVQICRKKYSAQLIPKSAV
jgi:hypothetical protein